MNTNHIPQRPDGPINPAEVPAAKAVLDSALLNLHPKENYPQVYEVLRARFGNLAEELYAEMFPDACEGGKVIPMYSNTSLQLA